MSNRGRRPRPGVDDASVLEREDSLRVFGHRLVMGDHDQRPARPVLNDTRLFRQFQVPASSLV